MKQQIPINALSGNVAPTITSHYHKAGWSDLRPRGMIGGHKPEIAILEIEMEEPKIMQIGSYVPNSMCAGKVVDADGIAPTVMENHGMPTAVIEPLSCAIRGRNPDCPSDRTAGINTEQRLEIGSDVANYLTSVQKDSLLLEPIKIRQATGQGYIECPAGGGFDAAYPNSKLRRGRVQNNGDVVGALTASGDEHCVYEGAEVIGSMQANAMRGSIDGVSPCLTEAMGMGGGQIPMITEPSILGYTRDDKGGIQNYHEREVAGTIHTSSGSGGNTDQYVKESISRQDNIAFKEMPDGNIRAYDASTPDKRGVSELQITNADNIAPTITTSHEPKVLLKYRIRKLTERECFRLMGVDDSDIEKLKSAKLTQTLKSGKVKEKPMPKTQFYKMAGNSIVVSCLYYIFYQMFIAEPPKPQSRQLTLFD